MSKFLLYAIAGIPILTSAHVKWFTEGGQNIHPYSLLDTPVQVWILIAILTVIVFYILEKKIRKVIVIPENIQKIVLTVADIGIGISFLLFSYFSFVFAPNIIVGGSIGTLLLITQAVIGVCFLFGIYTRIAAIALIIMYAGGVYSYGWLELADCLEILGFGIYGLIAGHPKWSLVSKDPLKIISQKFTEYSVPLLRVFIGLNLIGLGLSEKILRPDLGMEFLEKFNWNFTPILGFPISDYWFVFSAGMGEMILGILLLFGLMTRTTTVLLSLFLITTLLLLGPTELVGHLPHFSLAIVLLVLGSGNKLKL